jgi:hypothetical protein
MRLFFSVLLTALIVPLAAQAHSPSACPTVSPPEFPPLLQFVGLTEATVQGRVGLPGFMRVCEAEYPDSHPCTSRDLIEGDWFPQSFASGMWVLPVWTDTEHSYSGRFDALGENCPVILPGGDGYPIMGGIGCNSVWPVPCCAEAP